MNLNELVRNVPDFPKPGIQFKDITTLIKNGPAFREVIEWMTGLYRDQEVDKIVAVESRGFIFGAPVAIALGKGVVLVRKKGKLPADTIAVEYDLEYGQDVLEMHSDAIEPGEKVVIVDDLLATGGTTEATVELIKKVPAEIAGVCCLIELTGLNGRERLKPFRVDSLIQYECD